MTDQHVYEPEASGMEYPEWVCKHCGGQEDDGKRHLGDLADFAGKIIGDAAQALADTGLPSLAEEWFDEGRIAACVTVSALLEEFEQRRDHWSRMHPDKDNPRSMAVLSSLYSTCDSLENLLREMETFRDE